MSTPTHAGLTWGDVNSIKDESVRLALKKALADGLITDQEVEAIIQSALGDVEDETEERNVRRVLGNEEIKALWLIADKSRSISAKGRERLTDFLQAVSSTELIYQPKEKEGWAFPGMNFAGKGFRHIYSMRPRNLFDFAGKIHDLGYQLNGLDVKGTPPPKAQSRKAKADYIFRQMNKHVGVSGAWSSVWNAGANKLFDGDDRSEFLAGDGFINPLTAHGVMEKLSQPKRYLMIPYDELPLNQQPEGKKKYYLIQPYDYKPGFVAWFNARYGGAWTRLSINSHTGPA